MLEFLQANSSLPSLHPAIIHFPIALALTALLLRLVQVVKPKLGPAGWSANLLGALAAAGAGAAWLSGRQAANAAGGLSAAAEVALARHADLAGWTAMLLTLAALVPVIWLVGRRQGQAGDPKLQSLVNLGVLAVAVGVMGWTADLGGALVYDHGVGVRTAAVQAQPTTSGAGAAGTEGAAASTEAVPFPGGRADWEFMPGVELNLAVAGSGLVALPDQWGDSVIEATLEPGDFAGTIALVHRYAGPDDWEGFEFTTDGEVRLVRQTAAGLEVRAKSSLLFAREKFTMRSSAVSGHFKGLVDDDVVVHGHGESPAATGQVGLLLNVTGSIRLISMTASSADEH